MEIGIGLPNAAPGVAGSLLLEWARRAETRGFSTLGTIGRVAYPSYDSLIVLAAAAGATQRIRLLTNVLLGPTQSPVLLAKEAASLDQVSGGRFILGVGVGGREDDFVAAGAEFKNRGRRWDEALDLMHRAWQGEAVAGSPQPVTPTPVQGGRVPILIGGGAEEAIARTVRWGIGWTSGGGGPERAAPVIARLRAAWHEAGRAGAPRIVALQYYALGADAATGGTDYLKAYYSFMGPMADMLAASIPRSPEALREVADRFVAFGYDEVVFSPTIAAIEQVDLLADAVLSR